MKKVFVLAALLCILLRGAAAAGSKMLVVYFSMPETDKAEGMNEEEEYSTVVIDGKVLGNTQYVAQLIQKHTGADIFRIEPRTPYMTDHDRLVDYARSEQRRNVRPEMLSNIDNLGQYDVVFIGYPNWWGDMPMILYTFFEANDFSGKTIVPFITHGGSGFSSTIRTIARLEPDAKVVTRGLAIYRTHAEDSEGSVVDWLKGLGYTK